MKTNWYLTVVQFSFYFCLVFYSSPTVKYTFIPNFESMRWIKKGEMSYAKENDNKCIRGHLVNYEDEFFVTQEGHYFYVLMRKKKKFYGRYT